jgi:hypothetical protein
MIDTDKYEGHTKGPWFLNEEYAYELFICAGDVRHGNVEFVLNNASVDVNAQLLADAPLLLEHVKRLTKTLELIGKNMEYDPWMHTLIKDVIGYEKAEVKQLRERVATLDSLMEYIAEDYEEKVIE